MFTDAHGALPSIALKDETDLKIWKACLSEACQLGKLPAEEIATKITLAFEAFEKREWSNVISILEPILPQVVRIGGSRAQRDLIQNTLISAYIKDARPQKARKLLDKHTERAQTVPVAGFN